MKILHTSDWHVDLHAAQVGDAAQRVREARWQAVARLTEVASEHAVDLVLVAGDTFDSVDADDATVERVAGLLNAFAPARVVVLPGNHDPLIAGGVWERSAWSLLASHVTLVLNAEPIEIPPSKSGAGCVLYPCPVRQKRSRLDPTELIPAREENDQRLRIGLAHGSLDAMQRADNFPIAQDRATVAGLDYLALGDWHGQRILGGGNTAYPGTPEATTFGEQRTGSALLVHLDDERRSGVRVEPIGVGQCRWLQRDVDLREFTDLADLETELLALGPADHALVRLRVRLLLGEPVAESDGGLGDVTGAPKHHQTSLLNSQAPAHSLSDEATWVESVEAFRSKWSDRLLFLDWQLDHLDVASSDLPRGLDSVDAVLAAALATDDGAQLDVELRDLAEVDPAVLTEARWQLRMLAAEAAGR